MQCSKLFSSKNAAKIVDFLYFSFFSFLRTLLISPLLLWEKMEFPVACRHLGVLGSRHVSPSTVLLLSFPLRRRRTHSEDSRKQKLELCVLLQLSELLPHTARQGKRKAGHQAHCLQGKRGQAHTHTHTPLRAISSLSKPRKQQNLFSLHWKYGNRMGSSFSSLHRAPVLPVSDVMQFFRQVATAGGLSYTKWNSKLCFQM